MDCIGVFHMAKKINQINFEKIGIYIGCIGILVTFWNSQMKMMEELSSAKERIVRLEVLLEKIGINK